MRTTAFAGRLASPVSGPRLVVRTQVPRIAALLAGCSLFAALPAVPADLFVKVDQPGWTNTTQQSASAAWGDYDGDGFQDLFVANLGPAGEAWINFLYRNLGGGTFLRQTASEVGPIAGDQDATAQGCWGDVNNDGTLDLLAVNNTPADGTSPVSARLYVNQGRGVFTSSQGGALTAQHYHPGGAGVTSWCDYDNDGWLDAFLACASLGAHRTNVLLHGRGDAAMEIVTQGPVATDTLSGSGWVKASDAAWSDFDNDGDMDLFVSNIENSSDFAYRNEGRGRFTRMRESLLETPGYRSFHHAWGDFDNDGDLDVAVLTVSPVNNLALLRNEGSEKFVAVTNWPIFATISWFDYDNDGHLDLLLARGGEPVPLRAVLMRNQGDGSFRQTEDAFTRPPNRWWMVASGDYNNDGFTDLFCPSSVAGDNALFRNQGNGNHWIKFRLTGTAANRSAIGAKVRVRATVGGRMMWQMREVIATATSGNDLRPNFGLGDATVAEEVRIEWPSGNVTVLTHLPADQVVGVTEAVDITPVRPVATINGSVAITNRTVATARQWYFEGTRLEGQTGQVLSLTNTQAAQAGRYTVVAQTAAGLVTNHVHLRVLTQFTEILEGAPVTDEEESTGATWFDYDRDGHLDLFVATYSITPDASGDMARTDTLYHNRGDGTFERITGDPLVTTRGASWFGAPADIDNDGDTDMLTNWDVSDTGGLDQLFLNDGAGHFLPVAGHPFGTDYSETTACAWADLDLDGDLDLFAARGWFRSQRDALYWNQGNGTFTPANAEQVGPLLTTRLSSGSVVCFDHDGDGAQDLLVNHVQMGSYLHRNNRDGTFSRLPQSVFSPFPADLMSSVADYDNDGRMDVYLGAAMVRRSMLYRHLEDGTFADVTEAAGIRPPPREQYAVGNWADYDNDGFLDLFIASYATNSLYRSRGDGTFESVGVGNMHTDGYRRILGTWGDYDNNGFPDLYVVCGDGERSRNFLYRNNGNGNHWLKIRLVGTASNRDGLGARIRATATIAGRAMTQLRELSGHASWASVGDRLAHFGLGDAGVATRVRIEWPSGTVQELSNLAADQLHTITEPPLIRLATALVADGLRLEWRGAPNTSYTLQSSEGLKTWRTVQETTTDGAGLAAAILPTEGTARFFRVLER